MALTYPPLSVVTTSVAYTEDLVSTALPSVTWVSATTVQIDATGAYIQDSTGAFMLYPNTVLTADITSSGSGGLDTGAEASNTWYYLWVCYGSSGYCALLSASGTAPTLPTGYNTYKKLILPVRNDSASNILSFHASKKGRCYEVYYNGAEPIGNFRALAAGAATSMTAVDLSAFIPPGSTIAELHINAGTTAGALRSVYLRETGGVASEARGHNYGNSGTYPFVTKQHTSAARSIDYSLGGSSSTCTIMIGGWEFPV